MNITNGVRLPNFVVIGAPKSGTTSLFFYLKQHPDVYLPVRKELHYFSYSELAKQIQGPGDRETLSSLCADQNAYLSHYANVKREKAVGEISPSYLYFSHTAEHIKDDLGPVKIITLLRNPLEKAFSQYSHLMRDGREDLSFFDALMQEKERATAGWSDFWRYAESSLYTKKLKHYLSVFGDDNVKIFLFDNLVANPAAFMREVYSFLEIDPTIEPDIKTVYNRSGESRSKMVADFFAKPNSIKSLFKIIIPERVRISVRMKILDLNTGEKGRVDEQAKNYLQEYFANDVADLESLLGHKTHWLAA